MRSHRDGRHESRAGDRRAGASCPGRAHHREEEKRAAKKQPKLTSGQKNAIESAENYLEGQAFSKRGLIAQLKFEDYSKAEATFAVNQLDADWKAEAVEAAEGYLDGQSFSKSGLLDQLKFEQYTDAQAEYAVNEVY